MSNAQWAEVLRESGLKQRPGRFHMTDFTAREDVYRRWRQEKRLKVFDRLLEIIGSTILEAPRVYRRLHFLRGWGDGETEPAFSGGAGASGTDGERRPTPVCSMTSNPGH